jgi:hypothetical protein
MPTRPVRVNGKFADRIAASDLIPTPQSLRLL